MVDCCVNYPLGMEDAASPLPVFVAVVSPSLPFHQQSEANLSMSGRCAVDDALERP